MGSHTLIKVRYPLIEHNSIYYWLILTCFYLNPFYLKKIVSQIQWLQLGSRTLVKVQDPLTDHNCIYIID